MNPIDRIYRAMLLLYPASHRRVYGPLMLQHAHDMIRAERHREWSKVFRLCVLLIADGIVNAAVEHGQLIKGARNRYKPVPWLAVLLAAVPGLWVGLSRRHADVLAPLLLILGAGYILLIGLSLPILWRARRRFPVWGLLFAGWLSWFLSNRAGTLLITQLSQQMRLPNGFSAATATVILDILVAAILLVAMLRGQRQSAFFWMLLGLILFVNLLALIFNGLLSSPGEQWIRVQLEFLTVALIWPAEGLMFVALGLLAARQHGTLALLLLIGGYSYQFLEADYLFGYPSGGWRGLTAYLVAASLLFLVVAPVGLLRARTWPGRALAAFGPALLFLAARLIVPILAAQLPLSAVRPGDIAMSVYILLNLMLAWSLYGHGSDVSRPAAHASPGPWVGLSPTPNR